MSKAKDMTTGSPIKLIFFFMVPMLIGNIFQQIYNVVDSVIVGRFDGASALAAVGAAFPIFMLLLSFQIGLTMGSSAIISQYFGSNRHDKMRLSMSTAFTSLFVLVAVLSVVGVIVARPALILMKTPADILDKATLYLKIICGSSLCGFFYNALSAAFRSLGDSRTPLYFLIISALLNVVLDTVFVAIFRWGCAGVAIATAISQLFSAICCVFYIKKKVPILHFKLKELFTVDKTIFKQVIRYSVPSAINQCVLSVGGLIVQAVVNTFGTSVIAGYSAALKIDSIAMMPMLNISLSGSTFTAQNMGAGEIDRVKKGLRSSITIGIIFAVALTLLIFTCGPLLIGLFVDINTNQAVVEAGTTYLRITSSFFIFGAIMFSCAGVLRGSGDVNFNLVTTTLNLIIRVIAAYVLAARIGFLSVCIAQPVGWVICSALNFLRYLSGKWKTKAVTYTRRKPDEIPSLDTEL